MLWQGCQYFGNPRRGRCHLRSSAYRARFFLLQRTAGIRPAARRRPDPARVDVPAPFPGHPRGCVPGHRAWLHRPVPPWPAAAAGGRRDAGTAAWPTHNAPSGGAVQRIRADAGRRCSAGFMAVGSARADTARTAPRPPDLDGGGGAFLTSSSPSGWAMKCPSAPPSQSWTHCWRPGRIRRRRSAPVWLSKPDTNRRRRDDEGHI